MRQPPRTRQPRCADLRAAAKADVLNREEQRTLAESLARLLASGDAQPRRGSPWDITMPAGLDTPRPSQPFQEPLRGMAMREVIEPQIFWHFFGITGR